MEGRTQVRHNVPQFGGTDEAIAVLIENFEGFLDFFLTIGVFHLPCHHGKELGEVDSSVAVCIHFVDHILEFGFRGILAKGAHDGAQLFGSDRAITVCLEYKM